MKKHLVPYSGGLDSTTLLYNAVDNNPGDEFIAVFYDYGQKHREREQAAAKDNVARLYSQAVDIRFSELNLSFLSNLTTSALTNSSIDIAKTRDVLGDPQTVNYVPFRNQILLSIACALAEDTGADFVYHGAAQIDSAAGFWDGTTDFMERFNALVSLNRKHRIEVKAPLINMSKAEIIQRGVAVGVDFSRTWTCYEGAEKACGECTACSSRIAGFLQAGIIDPLKYNRDDIPW